MSETDNLSGPDLAAALRREGLFVHVLNKWRTQRDLSKIATEKKTSVKGNPLSAENRRLKEENERLQKRLKKANEIIDLQKKKFRSARNRTSSDRRELALEIQVIAKEKRGEVSALCKAVDLHRSTYYRLLQPPRTKSTRKQTQSPRSLSGVELYFKR